MRNAFAGLAIAVVLGGIAFAFLGDEAKRFDDVPPQTMHVRPFGLRSWIQAEYPESDGWRLSAYEVAVPQGGKLAVTLADRAASIWANSSDARTTPGTEIVACGIRQVAAEAFYREYPDAVSSELQAMVLASKVLRDYYVYRLVRSFQPERGEAIKNVVEGAFLGEHAPDPRSEIGSGALGLKEGVAFAVFPVGKKVALHDWMLLPRWMKPFDRAYAALPETVESAEGKQTPIDELEEPVWRFSIQLEEAAAAVDSPASK